MCVALRVAVCVAVCVAVFVAVCVAVAPTPPDALDALMAREKEVCYNVLQRGAV